MRLDRLTVRGVSADLSALAYAPDGQSKPVCCVLSHGFTSSKATMDLLAAYLAGRGYPCLTFDARGHKLGGSTGTLESMDQAVSDLREVVTAARERFESSSIVLMGHSMGALVGMAVAAEDAEVVGLVAIATGAKPSRSFTSAAGKAMLEQRAAYVDGAAPLTLLRQMDALSSNIERLGGRPSLFVAARNDLLVRPDTLRSLSLLAGPRSEFIEVDAQHLDAPDRARGAVAAWLEKAFSSTKE